MSRFWAAGSSSGSDSSDEDSSDYSSDDSRVGGGANAHSRWIDMSSESDSEDSVREVKSAKERAFETFAMHIKNLRKAMKDRDYYAIQVEFDLLSKAMVKAKQILAKGVPRSLVRILVDMEDYNKERLADKAAFKKLSARQGRALNKMKLTLRKHNKAYQAVMAEYRKNPVTEESDEESESSSSSESGSGSGGDSASDKGSDSDSSSDSSSGGSDSDGSESGSESESDWGSSSSSSSSDDEDGEGQTELKGRARWLKKVPTTKRKDKPTPGNVIEKPKPKDDKALTAAADAKDGAALTATKSLIPEADLTPAVVIRKVKEIASQRGRRGTDNRQRLRHLEALSRLSLKFGPRVEIPILMHVISAQFDMQRTLDDYMETNTWRACAGYLYRIADILDDGYKLGVETVEEVDLILGAGGKVTDKMKAAASATGGAMAAVAADEKLINPHTGEPETEDQRAERIRQEKEATMTEEEKKTILVVGSLSLFLSRLEEEYTKSLQKISPHTPEYVARLRDEYKLVELLRRMQDYFMRVDGIAEAALLAQLRIEHVYYRHDTIAKQVDKASEFYNKFGDSSMLHLASISNDEAGTNGTDFTISHPAAVSGKPKLPDGSSPAEKVDWKELMQELCTFVYKNGTDMAKNRAIICHIFHHAIHDRFLDARDLLLMSHLQENIFNIGDVGTMILFNRMMVNLGMCAFRLGRIWEAHQCLSEVCSGRSKELLAQGVGRYGEKSAEQEKAEKRRQVPYHQHINLDLLEACHLISAMLLEVPNMAALSVDGEAGTTRRTRVISRTFRKHNDIYDRQVFTGPPEQTRDYVMRASKALMKGDWKTCSDLLTTLDVWQLVPGENSAEEIKTMLKQKIKLEGLRTYLFAFSAQYDSLSLTQLCGMFDMDKNEVHSVVSKMMINRELYASWDQPTETIVMRKVEPSSLQLLALQFADKAVNLVEANERLLDAQTGSYGYRDEYWKGGDNDDRHGNRGGYRGGGGGGGWHGSNRRSGGGGNRGRGNRRNY